MYARNTLFVLTSLVIILACDGCRPSLYQRPCYTDDGYVNMVVEIPSGTNKKYEFDPASGNFELEIIDNYPRTVNFLPYPGNYGFIPSTMMKVSEGGDGDALDILLLCESLPQGKVIPVIPIAVLQLLDSGEKDDKILAIPADKQLQTINCKSLKCLQEEYASILLILENWFIHYKKPGIMEFKGWGDEKAAMNDINRWKI